MPLQAPAVDPKFGETTPHGVAPSSARGGATDDSMSDFLLHMEARLQESIRRLDNKMDQAGTHGRKTKNAPHRTSLNTPSTIQTELMERVGCKVDALLADGHHEIYGNKVASAKDFWDAVSFEANKGDLRCLGECDGRLAMEDVFKGLKCLAVVDVDEAEKEKLLIEAEVREFLSALEDQQGRISLNSFLYALEAKRTKPEFDGELANCPRPLTGASNDKLVSTFAARSYKAGEEAENRGSSTTLGAKLKHKLKPQNRDSTLDLIMAIVICANGLSIGLSMDYDYAVFFVLDVLFTISFVVELFLKWFATQGAKTYFSTPANVFDFCLILIDIVQLVCGRLMKSNIFDGLPSAALFRICRLARLTRLVRMVKLQMVQDLIAMVTGIVGGLTTLMWSIILFFVFLYVIALCFRELYGNSQAMVDDTNITNYFNSVPRAILTVFRYNFGDFDLGKGSLLEAVPDAYGSASGIFVCTLFFVVNVGVFNVITAIFVESTVKAAEDLHQARKHDRLTDNYLWLTCMQTLIKKLFVHKGIDLSDTTFESYVQAGLDGIMDETIEEDAFGNFIQDPEVTKALRSLDIDEADDEYMFDILDSDNGGQVTVAEVIDGLQRLRGNPRRSDVITIDLMARDIQAKLNMLLMDAGLLDPQECQRSSNRTSVGSVGSRRGTISARGRKSVVKSLQKLCM